MIALSGGWGLWFLHFKGFKKSFLVAGIFVFLLPICKQFFSNKQPAKDINLLPMFKISIGQFDSTYTCTPPNKNSSYDSSHYGNYASLDPTAHYVNREPENMKFALKGTGTYRLQKANSSCPNQPVHLHRLLRAGTVCIF